MKIILLQDVKGVGRKSDIKDVSDGYARNFLIPRKLAAFASESSVKMAEVSKKQEQAETEIRENLARKSIEMLKGAKLVITKKVNDKGHLFAALHADEICELIKSELNLAIEPENIHITKPIKEIGLHKLEVAIGKVKGEFELTLEAKN